MSSRLIIEKPVRRIKGFCGDAHPIARIGFAINRTVKGKRGFTLGTPPNVVYQYLGTLPRPTLNDLCSLAELKFEMERA